MSYRELLLGAGTRRNKPFYLPSHEGWHDLTTIDIDPDHKPDVVWDLNQRPLPFDDDSFDEIHAYEVLEHIGTQGDWRGFFEEFSEYARILKTGGHLFATVPWWQDAWAWGDPGHTRVIQPQTLGFLSQSFYEQVGTTPASDYRFVWKHDFSIIRADRDEPGTHLLFALKLIS